MCEDPRLASASSESGWSGPCARTACSSTAARSGSAAAWSPRATFTCASVPIAHSAAGWSSPCSLRAIASASAPRCAASSSSPLSPSACTSSSAAASRSGSPSAVSAAMCVPQRARAMSSLVTPVQRCLHVGQRVQRSRFACAAGTRHSVCAKPAEPRQAQPPCSSSSCSRSLSPHLRQTQQRRAESSVRFAAGGHAAAAAPSSSMTGPRSATRGLRRPRRRFPAPAPAPAPVPAAAVAAAPARASAPAPAPLCNSAPVPAADPRGC